MQEILLKFFEVAQNDIVVGRRDRYIAQKLADREVILCGPLHIKAVREMMIAQGKSFCTVHPAQASLYGLEDIRDPNDYKLAEKLLKEIEQ